jgi:hypothetical protein
MCKILCSTRICHFFSKKSRQSHSFPEIDHDVGCNYCRWKDATGFRRKKGQNQCGGLATTHSEGRLKSNRMWALQQDCAPAHSTKSTISLCNKIFLDLWDKEVWPPFSLISILWIIRCGQSWRGKPALQATLH